MPNYIATYDNYAYFSKMQIRSGAFFNSDHVNRKMAVAVLNEAATYQMFGNYENQVNYYKNYISENPLYEYAGTYADE